MIFIYLSCVLQPYFTIKQGFVCVCMCVCVCVNSLEFSTYNIMSFVNIDSFTYCISV